jgi:hypothetical protein
MMSEETKNENVTSTASPTVQEPTYHRKYGSRTSALEVSYITFDMGNSATRRVTKSPSVDRNYDIGHVQLRFRSISLMFLDVYNCGTGDFYDPGQIPSLL